DRGVVQRDLLRPVGPGPSPVEGGGSPGGGGAGAASPRHPSRAPSGGPQPNVSEASRDLGSGAAGAWADRGGVDLGAAGSVDGARGSVVLTSRVSPGGVTVIPAASARLVVDPLREQVHAPVDWAGEHGRRLSRLRRVHAHAARG